MPGPGLTCPCACGTTAAAVTAPALGNAPRIMLRPKKVIAVPMGDVDSREIFPGRPDTVHDPPAVIGREAGVDQDRSRSPVISDTEVVGQVVSRFGIGVIFPTIDLYGQLVHGDSTNSAFHSISWQFGTLCAEEPQSPSVSRARPEGCRGLDGRHSRSWISR